MSDASNDHNPLKVRPAAGPRLGEAIDQALQHLAAIAVRRDFDPKSWPPHAQLWRELLTQSKDRERPARNIAPNLLKGDLAAPIAVDLSGRHWGRFQKWFERCIAPELVSISKMSNIPALKAVRVADPKGGFPDQSEAVFFLAYLEPVKDAETVSSVAEQCSPSNLCGGDERDAGQRSNFISIEQNLPDASGNAQESSYVDKCGASATDETSGIFCALRYATCSVAQQDCSGDDAGKVRSRWQFGLSMALLGFFLLVLCGFFLDDSHRFMFLAFSVILFVAGIWDMDRGNKGIPR